VRAEQLRAHLEIYVTTLPQITTLRLCNRFGTGDNCHVNKMPIELIKLVEEHLIEPERQSLLDYHSGTLKCCEGSCDPLDHYNEEKLSRLYHSTFGCLSKGCRTDQRHDYDECGHTDECGGDNCPAWKYDRESILKMRKQLEENPDVHYNDSSGYCDVMRWDYGHELDDGDEFYKNTRELLIVHFGISVWTGKLRPRSMRNGHHTVTAYLTLPGNVVQHEDWKCYSGGAEEVGYGMPVNVGAPPTELSLSRFPRTLKILGLQAWAQPIFEGQPVLSLPSVDSIETKIDHKAVAEPRLTLLVRNKLERYW
jgi:hypothetical protein